MKKLSILLMVLILFVLLTLMSCTSGENIIAPSGNSEIQSVESPVYPIDRGLILELSDPGPPPPVPPPPPPG